MSITATAIVFLSTIVPTKAFTSYPRVSHANSQSMSCLASKQPIELIQYDDGDPSDVPNHTPLSRRLFASQVAVGAGASLFFLPESALAGIDVSSLKSLPIESDASGAATRLKQLQQQGTKVVRNDPNDMSSFTRLDSGVSYREMRGGIDGIRKVKKGSIIGTQMSIRCKSLATADEPGGLLYFSTRDDTDSNELVGEIGTGDFPRGLEEGMLGMKLNAVRRIEVPSPQIFAARNAGQLPEAKTEDGKRRYDDLFKSGDATLLFEVFITQISQGDNRI